MNFVKLDYYISDRKRENLDEMKPLFYIEVESSKDEKFKNFDYILIKNYYTHTINIVQFFNEKWKCVLGEFNLMPDPDCEEESESYVVINKKQLLENGFSELAKCIRIYLSQESQCWNFFTLREIFFIKESLNVNTYTNSNNLYSYNEGGAKIDPVKFCMSNNRFEFNYNSDADVNILNDKDEINSKFSEIMNKGSSYVNFSIFK